MANLEHQYRREGPEPLVRAFFYVFKYLLVDKGFHETIEYAIPTDPDVYAFSREDEQITVELRSSGPGTLGLTIDSTAPVQPLLHKAVEVFVEGIRVLLDIKPGE